MMSGQTDRQIDALGALQLHTQTSTDTDREIQIYSAYIYLILNIVTVVSNVVIIFLCTEINYNNNIPI